MFFPLLLAAAFEFTPADAHVAWEAASQLVVDCTPRDAGTIRGRIAANRILDVASATGADVRRDVFRAMTPKGEREFANLYAEFRSGSETDRWVVVISHFDTKPGTGCPGANDGASTSGLLVGLSNALLRRPEPKGNVMLVWTDGEESMVAYGANDGFWGSKRAAAYVAEKGRRIQAVVCVDMIGDEDLHISIPSNGSPALARIAQHAARRIGEESLVSLIPECVLDDHVAFLDRGYKAIDLIDFSYGPGNAWWHTAADTMEHVSEKSLLRSGKLLVEMLKILL